MIRSRLYLQIYATIVAALVLTAVLSGLAFAVLGGGDRPSETAVALAQRALALALPPASAPLAEHQAALEGIGGDLAVDLSLFDGERRLVASSGRPLPAPASDGTAWTHAGGGPSAELRLPDGRWIAVRVPFPGSGRVFALPLMLASVALAVASASYPLVRRLTGRLERLQGSVERMGGGDLGARAKVEGRDEIAALAASFNEAAGRIETLVDAHRTLLANTSHELRTPLSRIRMGLEMAQRTGERRRLAALDADIRELDRLIGEILTLSRLDAAAIAMEPDIDLLGLVAEECAGMGAEIEVAGEGGPALVRGDRELLRRLVRNLVANALRHGAPPVAVRVRADDQRVTLTVSDAGEGIATTERERVFERFYRGAGKQNVEGYGLGLPLVREIARAHGGRAWVAEGATSSVVVALRRV